MTILARSRVHIKIKVAEFGAAGRVIHDEALHVFVPLRGIEDLLESQAEQLLIDGQRLIDDVLDREVLPDLLFVNMEQ